MKYSSRTYIHKFLKKLHLPISSDMVVYIYLCSTVMYILEVPMYNIKLFKTKFKLKINK